MSILTTHSFNSASTGKTWNYLAGGPSYGPLIVFLHGWPGIAETWRPQLTTFAGLGFRVIAPDMPGYGKTWTSDDPSEFALEKIVPQLLELLHHLGRKEAIWVGHDWGCGPLWAIAAHHPEVCKGVAGISVPYRSLEMGLDVLISLVDRELYPQDKFPYGQFDYQVFYEQSPKEVNKRLESDVPGVLKLIFGRGNEQAGRSVARTSLLTKDGGWFGGNTTPIPQIPLEYTVLDQELLDNLTESINRNGYQGATSWYLNHKSNEKYAEKVLNNGVLKMPVLFIHTEYDAVCQTVYNSKLMKDMRDKCERLSEFVIKTGHWGNLESPEQTSAGTAAWIMKEVPNFWPGPQIGKKGSQL